eukprot:1160796-Pelagomonas_calceolata.AAC.3
MGAKAYSKHTHAGRTQTHILAHRCKTSGIGDGCYPEIVAKTHTHISACRCKTGGVGTGCYPEKVAKKLPEKFFECDIEQTPEDDVSAVQMEAKVEETKAAVSPLNCMAKETADACDESDACNW